MNIIKTLSSIFITFFVLISQKTTLACSMYKITVEGKTMVGCNEDAWRTTSRIWFENAKGENEYGAAFTGSRQVSANKFAPQSGMNEAGLVFSRLTSYHPKKEVVQHDKKRISNEVSYLSSILHQCASVEEVADFINQYDHSFFIEDVFIYIDSTGKYLVVEPYQLIEGDDDHYVLSNFCPSITEYETARKIDRYRKGEDFLKEHKMDASLPFCTALSDTMHVCRNRNGDGTLLTSIWDVKNGLVNLFFYHSYDTTIQFNIADELAKGDHILNIANLFPANPEFEQLSKYITPFNTPQIRVLLVLIGGLLTFLSFIFGIVFIKNRKTIRHANILLGLSVLNLLTTFYFSILATNINIYYFDAPYEHYNSALISCSSYIPILMLFSIFPIMIYTIQFAKEKKRKSWLLSLLLGNNLIYIISIFGFAYWGFFDILN